MDLYTTIGVQCDVFWRFGLPVEKKGNAMVLVVRKGLYAVSHNVPCPGLFGAKRRTLGC